MSKGANITKIQNLINKAYMADAPEKYYEELFYEIEKWRDSEKEKAGSKPIFNINDYADDAYAMHCDAEYKANKFLKYLNNLGRRWNNGCSYLAFNNWEHFNEITIYCFNIGRYGKICPITENNYIILDFDDFDWSM